MEPAGRPIAPAMAMMGVPQFLRHWDGWELRLDRIHVTSGHGHALMAITLFLPFRLDLDLFPCTHRDVGLKETFREEYYRILFGAMQPSECPPLLVSSVARHKLAGSNCCSYTQLHDTVI